MKLSDRQWQKLRELRQFFLSAKPNRASYWDSEETVELYDQTLAVRIGWRWDAVISQLHSLRWQPREKLFLDWGCGSGIASQKILDAFPNLECAYLTDLSPHAEHYTAKTVRTKFPAVSVRTGIPDSEPFCLVLSHVLGELDETSEEQLAAIASRASSLIWVEGGSAALSKKLGLWRKRLDWPVIAPCTHRQPCGMLAPENHLHWCHFFTRPPGETFMSAEWAEFAKQLEIDHRTVAFSYLVLDRAATNQPAGLARSIGSIRVYKASVKLQLCDVSGLQDVELMKRDFPEVWRDLKKGRLSALVKVETKGDRISQWSTQERLSE
jgi:ribosomal protein RSM22 (predicted rRNA methylase)